MGLYTKIDNQLDNYYELVSINKRLVKRNFYLKVIILFFLIIPRKAGYCNHLRVSVCLFVCLFVSRISHKLLVGF